MVCGKIMLAVNWAMQQLAEHGYENLESPVAIRKMPWSTISHFKTSKEFVYLKKMAKPFVIEPKILQFLFKNVSTSVTEIIAENEKLSCFLMKNAGQPLRKIQQSNFQTQVFCEALKIYADIQIACIPQVHLLVEIGINDWRLEKIPKLYKEFIAFEHRLKMDGLNHNEIKSLQKLSPKIETLCKQLFSYNIPETLEHGDFQDNNILIQDKRITISDWGDACISHPFFSLVSALNSIKRNHNLQNTDEIYQQAKNAYLNNWLEHGTKEDIYRAFNIAEKLHYFMFALSFSRIYLCVKENFNPYKGYMAGSLRQLLVDGENT